MGEDLPGQYHPISEISGDLMSHLRYPENLFKVQRELLAKYHVSSAGQFFSGEDFWQTPVDPTESATAQQQGVPQPRITCHCRPAGRRSRCSR